MASDVKAFPCPALPPTPCQLPATGTHVGKQREVQVPPQMAHGASAPVLKHMQVHLPLVLGGGRWALPSAQPPPPSPPLKLITSQAELTSSHHGGT